MKATQKHFFICIKCGMPASEVEARYEAYVEYVWLFTEEQALHASEMEWGEGDRILLARFIHHGRKCECDFQNDKEFRNLEVYTDELVLEDPESREEFFAILERVWGESTDRRIADWYGDRDTMWQKAVEEMNKFEKSRG